MASKTVLSVEDMVRQLLRAAVLEGAVDSPRGYTQRNPLDRSSGEIVGTANLLAEYLRTAEELARCLKTP